MEVDVPYRLTRRFTIVLPDGDAGTVVRGINGPGGVSYLGHQRSALDVGEIKEGLPVRRGYDQKVRNSTLLLGHHDRCRSVSGDKHEGSSSAKIGTERTRLLNGKLNR